MCVKLKKPEPEPWANHQQKTIPKRTKMLFTIVALEDNLSQHVDHTHYHNLSLPMRKTKNQ